MITRNDREEAMMNEHKIMRRYAGKLLAVTLGIALITAPPLFAAEAPPAKAAASQGSTGTTEIAPYLELSVGQSHLIRLPEKARLEKVSVDNPNVAQVKVTSLREIVVNGKAPGSAVLMLKDKSGQTTVVDVSVVGGAVGKVTGGLQGKLQQLLPGERYIRVASAADTIVLTGTATDAVKVDRAVALAEAYSGKKVLNFLQVGAPQQVMLEVKVAEVDKTLTDALGSSFTGVLGGFNGNMTYSLLANFLTGGNNTTPNAASITLGNAQKSLTLDGAKQDGLVKILAEPNIMAMSGQEGSFLAGGSIYIPVPQVGVGGSTITLEQKDFGVALRFTPVVLEDGRINLKVAPEVSELGRNITVGTQLLPTITTRRSATTVQLHDGQSFAIGGLIKNNVTATMTAFPGLGELPVIGALFRSTSFVHDRSELVFVITPRLVKPLPPDYVLPTDNYIQPSRAEYLLQGKLEGSPKAESQPPAEPQPQAASGVPEEQAQAGGGFQMK